METNTVAVAAKKVLTPEQLERVRRAVDLLSEAAEIINDINQEFVPPVVDLDPSAESLAVEAELEAAYDGAYVAMARLSNLQQ